MYTHVIAGGTFDGLHLGHQAFLAAAFAAGQRVTIGLTSDAYIRRFKDGLGVRSFGERKKTLEDWITTQKAADKVEVVAIDNIFGPANLGEFDAIVATSETRQNALDINKVRVERGLPELAIIDVLMVPAEDSKPISSTRIRAGVIDREGHLTMPDALRPELQKPLGKLLISDAIDQSIKQHKHGIVVTVGDVATKTLLDVGVVPTLSVVDFFINRKASPELKTRLLSIGAATTTIQSGPGYISKTALDTFEKWGEIVAKGAVDKTVIIVDGEEDLLALLAIGHAPPGTVVYYGQPPVSGPSGLVEVMVTPEKKKEVAVILQKFV
jgi:pantetheine-phosphate adenylyltransferase